MRLYRQKKRAEKTLFASIDNKPWNDLEQALQNLEKYHAEYFALEVLSGSFCKYYAWAQHIVRGAQEKTKPNEARLAEYRESKAENHEAHLSTEPVYPALEKAILIDSLERLVKLFRRRSSAVLIALNNKSIEQRTDELIDTTRLADRGIQKTAMA